MTNSITMTVCSKNDRFNKTSYQLSSGQNFHLKAEAHVRYIFSGNTSSNLVAKQVGNHLHIFFGKAEQPALVLEDYYLTTSHGQYSHLVVRHSDRTVSLLQPETQNATSTKTSSSVETASTTQTTVEKSSNVTEQSTTTVQTETSTENTTTEEKVSMGKTIVTEQTTAESQSSTAIVISGQAKVGQTLTANTLNVSSTKSLSYQWFADGEAINGATDAHYTLSATDANKQISVQATQTNGDGVETKMTSSTTSTVSYLPVAVNNLVFNVNNFGAKGNGQIDDTAAIQKAIDAAGDAGGGTVIIPSGTYLINGTAVKGTWDGDITGLMMRSNVTVRMADDTYMKVLPNGSPGYSVFTFKDVENAHLTGGVLIGERHEHTGTEGELGFGVNILSSQNIVIENVTAKDFWGDGFVIQDTGTQPKNRTENVILNNVVSDGNRRQGVSVLDGENIKILHSTFKNTGGIAPGAGIDVEPEDTQSVNNLEIAYSKFTGNLNAGVLFVSVAEKSESITNVSFHDNFISGNKGGGLYADGLTNSSIVNNMIEQSGTYVLRLLPTSNGNTVSGNSLPLEKANIINLGDNQISGDIENLSSYATNQPGAVNILGKAQVGQTLTAEVVDGNGLYDTIYYQWYADGVAIAGATNKTYTLNTAQAGKSITVSATYEDWNVNIEKVTSASTAIVTDYSASNQKATVSIHGSMKLWENLQAHIEDADGIHSKVTYQWYADGVAIPGAYKSTFMPQENQAGKVITVQAFYTDGTYHYETPISEETVAMPHITRQTGMIVVSGTVIEGETLTASIIDGNGVPDGVAFQWYANGIAVEGANSASYTVSATDASKAITVRAVYEDPVTGETIGYRDNYWYRENPLGIAARPTDDTLYGDTPSALTGGSGADTFVFSRINADGNHSIITDFNAAEGDKIMLRDLLSESEAATNWFAADNESISETTRVFQKGNTLYYDADGYGTNSAPTAIVDLTSYTMLNENTVVLG